MLILIFLLLFRQVAQLLLRGRLALLRARGSYKLLLLFQLEFFFLYLPFDCRFLQVFLHKPHNHLDLLLCLEEVAAIFDLLHKKLEMRLAIFFHGFYLLRNLLRLLPVVFPDLFDEECILDRGVNFKVVAEEIQADELQIL